MGAVVALVVGSDLGDVHGHELHSRLIALGAALAFVVLATTALRGAAGAVFSAACLRVGSSAASALRLLITFAGYVVVLITALGLLAVPVEHLVLGGALTGVVVGIAAQQSLGNVFAGLVLLLTRPFAVGDHIRIRAGAYGGELDGTVRTISLTYVTVDTGDGPLHVPNSGVLAAAVGPRPTRGEPPHASGAAVRVVSGAAPGKLATVASSGRRRVGRRP